MKLGLRAACVFLALFVACTASAVAADDYEYRYNYGSKTTSWGTPSAMCAQVVTFITVSAPDGESAGYEIREIENCWVYVQNRYGKTWEQAVTEKRLISSACKADGGKTVIQRWTVGYTRTPDDNDYAMVGPVNKLPGPGNSVCFSGCTGNQGGVTEPGWRAWKSQSPTSEGLYRNSLEVPFAMTGQACAAGVPNTSAHIPSVANPTCPGYVGEVNGKKGCFGTAAAPIVPETVTPPVSKAPEAGNPPAGQVPAGSSSQTGAQVTPSTGTGGAAGGPAAAAVGGKGGTGGGTGTGTGSIKAPATGDQQQNCGAPGQPVCDVKLKEEGTPDKLSGQFKEGEDAIKAENDKMTEHAAKVSGVEDKAFFENFRSLWITPPIAACTPYDLPPSVGSLSINPCNVVDGVRSAMAYIWALSGLLLCFGMIKRSI